MMILNGTNCKNGLLNIMMIASFLLLKQAWEKQKLHYDGQVITKLFLFCLLDQRLMLFLIGLEHKHLAVKMNLMNTYLFYIRICPTR